MCKKSPLWHSTIGRWDWVFPAAFATAFCAALCYGSQGSNVLTILFGSLYSLAMMLFALLMAYIAVMALRTLPQDTKREGRPSDNAEVSTKTPQGTVGAAHSLTQTNLGKMAIAGLSGLAIFSALRPVLDGAKEGSASFSGDTFLLLYVFWFCLWFLALLFWGARLNARKESRRVEQERRRRPHLLDSTGAEDANGIARDAEVVYKDTFAAYIQGRNQLETGALAELLQATEDRYHARVTEIVNELQNSLQAAVTGSLAKLGPSSVPARIRIAFSLLSEDRTTAFYLSSQNGSLRAPFKRESVAVWSLENRQICWVTLKDGKPNPGVELAKGVRLTEWFQERDGTDYNAFIVFPTYLKRNVSRRTAALHVSFMSEADMHAVFPGTRSDQEKWRTLLEGDATAGSEVALVAALVRQVLFVLDGLVQEVQDRCLVRACRTPSLPVDLG